MHDRVIPKTQALAERLRSGEFIAAPGVYDMISARVADSMGFPAIYMTGSGVVASHLGLPDAGIATYTEMVSRAGQIVSGTRTPLIADADTGYGGTVNVRHTVQGYERAGVAAIQIEDQAFPKKCGHTEGQRLIPLEDMVRKIKVALDSRLSDDFLVIARTDARKADSKDEALRRLEAFQEAGADILFYEAPASVEEMEEAARLLDGPLMANMVEGGPDPGADAGRARGDRLPGRDLSRRRLPRRHRGAEPRLPRAPRARRVQRGRHRAPPLRRLQRADGLPRGDRVRGPLRRPLKGRKAVPRYGASRLLGMRKSCCRRSLTLTLSSPQRGPIEGRAPVSSDGGGRGRSPAPPAPPSPAPTSVRVATFS